MKLVKGKLKFKNKKSKAQSLIEYALILAMVTVIAITALQLLGTKMSSTLRNASETVGAGADDVQRKACESFGGTWTAGSGGAAGSCDMTGSTGGGSTPAPSEEDPPGG